MALPMKPFVTAAALLMLLSGVASHGSPVLGANVKDTLREAGYYSTLISLLEKTGLDATVQSLASSGLTLFAPTDHAFLQIQDVLPTLTHEQVVWVLKSHVLPSYLSKHDILKLSNLAKTASGCIFFISTFSEHVYVQTGIVQAWARSVVLVDSATAIYSIDTVLIPGELADGATECQLKVPA